MTVLRQFLTELRRRRVIRVLVLYAVAGWIIVQVASTVLPGLHVPQWSVTLVIVLVALGLPLAAILAWAFDVGDDGLKRTPAEGGDLGGPVTPAPLPASSSGPTALPIAGAAEQPASTPARAAVPAAAHHDGDRRSIAVLPFANLTGDPSKDYLGDGLAEELIHTLARVPGLRVPSRTSSFAYRGHDVDLRRIARELEVGAVLEGSVRAAGERIRITAQLIDGPSGYHLWSQHFDRRAEDLFELQDELASAIIMQTLNMTLHGPDQRRLLRGPPTNSLEAYQLYLEARPAMQSGGVRTAFDKLQLALRLDPGFAAARATMVYVRAMAPLFGVSLLGTLAEAEQEARQVLESAPDSAEMHRALGIIRAAQGRWLEAEASFRLALTLDETDPVTGLLHSAYVLDSVGHLNAALSSTCEAHRIAPSFSGAHVSLVADHVLNGNDDEARAHAQAAIDLGVPRTWRILAECLSLAELRAGRHDAACALMQEACMETMKVSRRIEAVDRVFSALAGTTDRALAVAALDGLRTDTGESMRRRLVMWYSMLGAYDQAYELINRSLDDFAATDTIAVGWGFLWVSELAGFRADSRFGALAERMHLPEYWERYGPPDGYDWRGGRLVPR